MEQPLFFKTISQLRATRPVNETLAFTAGYHSIGDFGGGKYVYYSNATNADDGGKYLIPTVGTGPGRWVLIEDPEIRAEQYGARGDDKQDDTEFIPLLQIDQGKPIDC